MLIAARSSCEPVEERSFSFDFDLRFLDLDLEADAAPGGDDDEPTSMESGDIPWDKYRLVAAHAAPAATAAVIANRASSPLPIDESPIVASLARSGVPRRRSDGRRGPSSLFDDGRRLQSFVSSRPAGHETNEGCEVASEAGRRGTHDRARDLVDAIWAVRKV